MAAGDTHRGKAAGAILATLVFSLTAMDAQACSTCGCTLNIDLSSLGSQGGEGWRLDFRYDRVDQTQLRERDSSVGVPIPEPDEVKQRTRNAYYDFGLDYGFNRSWGINLLAPYNGYIQSA